MIANEVSRFKNKTFGGGAWGEMVWNEGVSGVGDVRCGKSRDEMDGGKISRQCIYLSERRHKKPPLRKGCSDLSLRQIGKCWGRLRARGIGKKDLYKYKLVFYPVHTCPIQLEPRCHNCSGKADTGFNRITQDA
jgi:hypothetical protein